MAAPYRHLGPFLLMLAWVLLSSAQAAVTLIPTESVRTLEANIKRRELTFPDGLQKVSYRPPRDWTYSGDFRQITFYPKGRVQSEALISAVDTPPEPPPAKNRPKRLKPWLLLKTAMARLPKDALNVTVVTAAKSPVLLNRHETFEVMVTYDYFGQHFQTSVLMLPLDTELIMFETIGNTMEFQQVYNEFRASIYSWQWN